jgi:hypothetical protein
LHLAGSGRLHNPERGTLVVLDAITPESYVERRERLVVGFGEPLSIDRRPPEHAVAFVSPFSAVEPLLITNVCAKSTGFRTATSSRAW